MNAEFSIRLEKIESALAKYLPSKITEEWKSLSFGPIDSCINETHISNLLEPCRNLVSLGGKRWRPLLLVLCAELAADEFEKNPEKKSEKIENAYNLTPLVEFAHTASLIHDDIEDSSDMRRGKPATHITYGMDVALNAGSWLYFQAATCIKTLQVPGNEKLEFYELFLEELRRLHLGQAMDILWHRNPEIIPTEEEYKAMVRNKTGTLARLAVELGILAGGADIKTAEKAGKIAEDIGTGFQILDDVTNLTKGNPGKKRGDDVVEGKKSLPVLYHLESKPEDKETLARLFKQARKEGINSPAVENVIEILSASDSIEKARKTGDKIISGKSSELGSLFGNNYCHAGTLIVDLFGAIQKKA